MNSLARVLRLVLWASPALAEIVAPAGAQVEGKLVAHLELNSGEQCVSEAELAAAVSRGLGRTPWGSPERAQVTVQVRLVPPERKLSQEVWGARIELIAKSGDALGIRELKSPEPGCAPLVEALALVLSLAIDSPELEQAVEREEARHLPKPKVARRPASEEKENAVAKPTSSSVSPSAEPWHGSLSAQGSMEFGVQPSLAPALGGAFTLRKGSWWVFRAEGRWLFPQTHTRSNDQAPRDPSARFEYFEGGLHLCPRIGLTQVHGSWQWSVPLCLGGNWGRAASRGLNLDFSERRSTPRGAAELRFGVEAEREGFHFGAMVGYGLWLTQSELTYSLPNGERSILHEPPAHFARALFYTGSALF